MLNWENTILRSDSTIREVIENLNETSSQIVIIVDSKSEFVGVVVDGDIRRGLLKGASVDDSVNAVVNRSARTITSEISRSEALILMGKLKIDKLPIVDSKGRVCGLMLKGSQFDTLARENLFVIMAGGYGKRMGSLTKQTPKPMLKVNGKPILEHIIKGAKSFGFTKFVISVHYKGGIIEEYFGDGSRFGIEIKYLREDLPLGTAGSLTLVDPLPGNPVVISNADLYLNVDFGALLDFHVESKSDATMAVRNYELQNPFGVVTINDGIIEGIVEKPATISTINAGVYVLEPKLISKLPKGEAINMTDVFLRALKMSSKVTPFPIFEFWSDIGQPSDLASLENQLDV